MSTYHDVSNAIARFFWGVDSGNWESVTAMMTSPIHIDYASFGAGEPADVAPQDVVSGWRGILPGFDHTHHQLGNLQIEVRGDQATAQAYVTATHVIDDKIWTVVGRYVIALVHSEADWRLSSLRFLFGYQAGAGTLPEEASRRAQEG